ncbi:MAG: hypothetical protein HY738_14425 [Bacteroidia bacterium]|nr:hypothetical protein [Bacteroidia bacterium]
MYADVLLQKNKIRKAIPVYEKLIYYFDGNEKQLETLRFLYYMKKKYEKAFFCFYFLYYDTDNEEFLRIMNQIKQEVKLK